MSINLKSHKKWYVLGAVVVLLVLTFIFLPGFLLRKTFNQDFNNNAQIFSSIRTEKVSVSPFLDKITLDGMVLTNRILPYNTIRLSEVRITHLKPSKLIKAILGIENDTFDLLSDGELVIRDLDSQDPSDKTFQIHASTISIEGFSLGLEPVDASRLDHVKFKSLKFSNLKLSILEHILFSSESLSFFDFGNSILGGLIIGAMDLSLPQSSKIKGLSLSNASASNLDLINLFLGLEHLNKSVSPYRIHALLPALSQLNSSIGSLDLSTLSVEGRNEELLLLRRALIDNLENNSQNQANRLWTLEELTVTLNELRPYLSDSPLVKAVLDCLEPRTTISLRATNSMEGPTLVKGHLNLSVKEQMDISFDLSAENPPTELGGFGLLASIPKLSLGHGELLLSDHSFLPRFSQTISQRFYNGQPVSEVFLPYLSTFLSTLSDPKPGGRPLNQAIVELELNLFLNDPQSLKLNIDPVKGYPFSVINSGDTKVSKIIEMASSENMTDLADKYKYAILSELNLSLEVNARAPVAIFLNPNPSPDPALPAD
jgi:hypothetical protein